MQIYRWLLRLSPAALRRDYGAAMEEMFARRLAEAVLKEQQEAPAIINELAERVLLRRLNAD